jgi:hypothetical protein
MQSCDMYARKVCLIGIDYSKKSVGLVELTNAKMTFCELVRYVHLFQRYQFILTVNLHALIEHIS